MQQTIILTGAGGGFGKRTTLALVAAGHNVVGTLRDIDGRNREVAAELRAAGAHVVEMDVTDDASVEAGVRAATEALGGRIDVAINNAGYGVMGLQEAFTPADWQKVFDLNVFGVVRVNRAVAPLMRAQGAGLVVHVSSLLGRLVLPYYGPYNASKWALEALAENYRVELSRFGVESVIVEPGGFPTSFVHNLIEPSDRSRDASYGDIAREPAARLAGFEAAMAANPAQDPQKVADAIVALIATPRGQRPVRTAVDFMGMADAIRPYNAQLEGIMQGLYGAFGMGDLLKVRALGR
jgi:NAD(P)-dependent dehydrogenase (short-subunit alcohol dehydrogenase family)